MQLQYADILKAYLLLLLWGGHLGFQVTLTLDSQNNIFIQSSSLDLVGIDTLFTLLGQVLFKLSSI